MSRYEIGTFDTRIREEHEAHTAFQTDIATIQSDISWIKRLATVTVAVLVPYVIGPLIVRARGLGA